MGFDMPAFIQDITKPKTSEFRPLNTQKTDDIQSKLNVVCFVRSCFAVADFVIFSNYCLIGTRPTTSIFLFYSEAGIGSRKIFMACL